MLRPFGLCCRVGVGLVSKRLIGVVALAFFYYLSALLTSPKFTANFGTFVVIFGKFFFVVLAVEEAGPELTVYEHPLR